MAQSVDSSQTDTTKNLHLTVMPYLSYNRNMDFLIGVIPMAMYRLNKSDTISSKSLSGVSAVYTTNESYFLAFFNQWYFSENKWRIQLFGLTGNYNSQFYVADFAPPSFYDYNTELTYISLSVKRRIIENLFGGITYNYGYYDTEYEDNIQPQSITETNGIKLQLQLDTRDDFYYPRKGKRAIVEWTTFQEWFWNDETANKIKTEYIHYFPSRQNRDVFAARFSGIYGLGNIAFQQQETIGGKDIRGYSEGKYRGDGIISLQGEYRFNFANRMGAIGYIGMATIYGSDNTDFNWKAYPGVGLGYRYKAFKDENFNIGLDGALGKDDWGVYFRIGEAF